MKFLFAAAVAATAILSASDAVPVKTLAVEDVGSESAIPHVDEEDVRSQFQHEQLFLSFKDMFNKQYASEEEEERRFANFKASLVRIEKQNKEHMAAHGTAVFGVNEFSDMTVEEFKREKLNRKPAPRDLTKADVLTPATPLGDTTHVDWRNKGAVTAVKNQGQCGSCWAFGATEAIESQWYIHKHHLVELAPQQLVSCDTVDQGCNGGDSPSAYQYVEQAGGIMPEADYPYTSGTSGSNGQCMFNATEVAASITGFHYATQPCYDSCDNQDKATLTANVATQGPPSICVYAESWMDYTSGVFKGHCPHGYNKLDHCVQLVGFDMSGAEPYWTVRNSWGTNWGESGYIRISADDNVSGGNLCGVMDEATIPEV